MKSILLLLSLLAISFSLPAQQTPTSLIKTIIILPADVRFVNIDTEQTYPTNRYQPAGLQLEVAKAAIARIRRLGATGVLADSVQGFSAAVAPMVGRLQEVFRKVPPVNLLDSLGILAQQFGVSGIMVFDILGRVGEDGALNPFDTGWDHATHICRVRAMLSQPATAQKPWKKEAVGRFLPRPQTKKFSKLLKGLFDQLKLT